MLSRVEYDYKLSAINLKLIKHMYEECYLALLYVIVDAWP